MPRFWFNAICLIACTLFRVAVAQNADVWHQRQSGASLSDCCFGGNQFVVVGDAGTIQHSSDGTNWITHQLGKSFFFHGVAYGNGKYVVVGSEQVISGGQFSSWKGVIFLSTNAQEWRRVSGPFPYALFGICFGNDEFVTVGAEGIALKSSDGHQWNTTGSGTDDYLYGAARGDGKLVMVGGEVARISTFANGALVKSQLVRDASKLRRVIYANNQFVAVGGALRANLLISSNGVEWLPLKISGAHSPLTAITFGNGRFLAVGHEGTMLSSSDATTWASEPAKATHNNLYGICFGAGRFLAVGSGPVILELGPSQAPAR